jgi:hypothetical protein
MENVATCASAFIGQEWMLYGMNGRWREKNIALGPQNSAIGFSGSSRFV